MPGVALASAVNSGRKVGPKDDRPGLIVRGAGADPYGIPDDHRSVIPYAAFVLRAEQIGRRAACAANEEPRIDAALGKSPSLVPGDQDRASGP